MFIDHREICERCKFFVVSKNDMSVGNCSDNDNAHKWWNDTCCKFDSKGAACIAEERRSDSLEAELDGLSEAFKDMKDVVLNVALYLMTKGACPLVAAAMLLSNEFPDRIMLPGNLKKELEDRLTSSKVE